MIYEPDFLCLPDCKGFTAPLLFIDKFAEIGSQKCVVATSCTMSFGDVTFGSLFGEHIGDCIKRTQCRTDGGYTISLADDPHNVCVETCEDY